MSHFLFWSFYLLFDYLFFFMFIEPILKIPLQFFNSLLNMINAIILLIRILLFQDLHFDFLLIWLTIIQ